MPMVDRRASESHRVVSSKDLNRTLLASRPVTDAAAPWAVSQTRCSIEAILSATLGSSKRSLHHSQARSESEGNTHP